MRTLESILCERDHKVVSWNDLSEKGKRVFLKVLKNTIATYQQEADKLIKKKK